MKYFQLDPLQEEPIRTGSITKEAFKKMYLSFPWLDMLEKLNQAKHEDAKYSPGICIENKEGNSVSVSIVGESTDYEFYISYKRPTLRKKRKWFKMVEYLDQDFCSLIPEQTLEDGLHACLCFFDKDYETLEKLYG